MKKSLFAAMLFASLLSFGAEDSGVISANTLNVRIRPETNSDTVAKLKRGDTVKVIKDNGKWVEIVAPDSASVYIAAPLFADGKSIKESNLRSGPGTNYQSYGIIPGGTLLTALEPEKNGWIKVAPIATMSCFVASEYVTLDKAKPAAATDKPAAVKEPVADKKQPVKPDENKIAILRKLFVKGSEKAVAVEGQLLATNDSSNVIAYGVQVKEDSGNKVYFLLGDVPAHFNRKQVKVSGTSHLVRKWNNPVLEITEIQLVK